MVVSHKTATLGLTMPRRHLLALMKNVPAPARRSLDLPFRAVAPSRFMQIELCSV
jgi:hypothetical protein